MNKQHWTNGASGPRVSQEPFTSFLSCFGAALIPSFSPRPPAHHKRLHTLQHLWPGLVHLCIHSLIYSSGSYDGPPVFNVPCTPQVALDDTHCDIIKITQTQMSSRETCTCLLSLSSPQIPYLQGKKPILGQAGKIKCIQGPGTSMAWVSLARGK